MHSYEIHKIINNPDPDFAYQPALDRLGETMIISDQILPDFNNNGAPRSAAGSVKVYRLIYDSYNHLSGMYQLGQTLTGTADENLGKMCGIDATGQLIIASSDTHLFKVYEWNSSTVQWDLLFTPGTSHAPPPGSAVGGFRVDTTLDNILIAYVDYSNGDTTARFYRRSGDSWLEPNYATLQAFSDRFNNVRGLWISDTKDIAGFPTPIAVHLYAPPMTNDIYLRITALAENAATPYGTITTYDNNATDYSGLSASISPNGNIIAISYWDKNDLVIKLRFYKVDSVPAWTMVHEEIFTPANNTYEQSGSIRMSDEYHTNGLPKKFTMSATYTLSVDLMYGIYKLSDDGTEYTQETSFVEKIRQLADELPVMNGFLDAAVNHDLNKVVTTIVGADPDANSGPPFGPIVQESIPQPGVHSDVIGNFANEGLGLVVFVSASPTPDPIRRTTSDPPVPEITPTTPPSPSTTGRVIASVVVTGVFLAILALIFFL
jgi:hypothetical protein